MGVKNAWLPVTHTASARGVQGLWFYYADGCSDLAWNVGLTWPARNRCHAVLKLEQRLRGGSEQEAAARAGKLLPEDGDFGLVRHRASNWLHMPNVTKGDLLAECARGLFGNCSGSAWTSAGTLRPCTCVDGGFDGSSPQKHWRVSSKRRALTFSVIAGNGLLDRWLGRSLRELGYDTLQLWQQPQGGGSLLWTSEIWDVRDLHLRRGTSERRIRSLSPEQLAKRVRRIVGTSLPDIEGSRNSTALAFCEPSSRFAQCMACSNSTLERVCSFQTRRADEPAYAEEAWMLAVKSNNQTLLKTRNSRLELAIRMHGGQLPRYGKDRSDQVRKQALIDALLATANANASATSRHRI